MGPRAAILTALAAMVAAAPAAAQNPWTQNRVLNIAHQGGEAEAPSNTMYAYERSLRLGADMLEIDIHTTADGRIVAMHDSEVDRTTDGTGSVYETTLDQVQRLDAAHDFVPGVGTSNELPEASYAFRGVRTGELPPPPGYRPRDFRIPTLDQVMRTYPDVPINIEIKGRADADLASFQRNAELLAEFLNRLGRIDGIIVASFNDAALDRFHALAPQIALAPAIVDVALFKAASLPLPEGMVAFQTPITFEGIGVTDADFVRRAHAHDYAVHVWLSNDGEDEGVYNQLLDWGVDGVMAAEPGRLERVLCDRGIARPARDPAWPGRHCSPRVSIACEVRATRALRLTGRRHVALTLERRDEFEGPCAGRLRLRAGRRTLGTARFDFGELAPVEGGLGRLSQRVKLNAEGSRRLRAGEVRARVIARPYDAFAQRSRVALRRAASG